jgi:hypothetical protein
MIKELIGIMIIMYKVVVLRKELIRATREITIKIVAINKLPVLILKPQQNSLARI